MTDDFYTRNRIERPVTNAKSRSELLDGRSREYLLRNGIREMQQLRKYRGWELWAIVSRLTSHGSAYSQQICEELGWNPHTKVNPKMQLPREGERAVQTRLPSHQGANR